MLTVYGMRGGRPCVVTWDNGMLSGTDSAVGALKTLAILEGGRNLPAHPEGGVVPLGLDTHLSAWYTVPLVFDWVGETIGFPPEEIMESPGDDNPDDDGEETLMEWEPGLHPRAYARGWDESKRRRWPKGTPGGLGGKFRDKASAAKLSKITGVPAAELLRDPSKAITGRATRKPGIARPSAPALPPIKDPKSADAIDVHGDVRLAARLLAEGKAVRLEQPREVAILLDELAKIVADAAAKGEKAPDYDLCRVTVKGQSLFCVESKGIPRIQMPQLKGRPEAGSRADAREKDKKGEVDLTADFVKMLEGKGFKTTDEDEHAAYLRPTQNQLDGAKVAGMVQWMKGGGDPNPARKGGPERELGLIVSEDNYIVDGHHRWAAQVGLDAADGRLGDDKRIPITRVDIDIITLLKEALDFTIAEGIIPKGVKDKNPANSPVTPP